MFRRSQQVEVVAALGPEVSIGDEAEKIAREREPGDGSTQKTVLEQIDAALQDRA